MNSINSFFDKLKTSISEGKFVKLTLSKPSYKSDKLINIYGREVVIKGEQKISFTYRYETFDEVKNYSINESVEELTGWLENKFKIATLFTLEEDIVLKISKKGKQSLFNQPPSFKNKPDLSHDRQKEKRAEKAAFLFHLGVCDEKGEVIPSKADKYKQINKYLEIVEAQLKGVKLPENFRVVDMGSGKGYLTFALYHYLVVEKKLNAEIVGIELREELVAFCNKMAQKCAYKNLKFINKPIEAYQEKIDVLIALHACDTATDDALFKGIKSGSQLIITAPCCHKQIRQQVKAKKQESPLLKYGIFKERQFEMVTDTMRALLLEQEGYDSHVFEFISNEHTRKNIMLVGRKNEGKTNNDAQVKLDELKSFYSIDEHYLEKLIKA